MSEYISYYDALYDLKPDDFERMNIEAHPGGGTETIEVPSGEGLVEDQYEAHLRGMEVAYREPLARILANLANDLEENGLSKTAARIDETLEQFVVEAQDEWRDVSIEDEVKELAITAENILDDANPGWIDYDVEVKAKQTLDIIKQEMDEEKPRWDSTVMRLIEDMRNETGDFAMGGVLTWSLSDLLERDPTAYRRFYNTLDRMMQLARTAYQEKEPEGRKREKQPQHRDLPQRELLFLQQIKGEAENVANVIEEVNQLARDYENSLGDPNLKENMSIRIREIFNKYILPIRNFLQNKDRLLKANRMPQKSFDIWQRALDQTLIALNNIKKELAWVYKELTTSPNPGTMVE